MDTSYARRLTVPFASTFLPTLCTRALCLSLLLVSLPWSPLDAQTAAKVHLLTVSPMGWPDGRMDAEWQVCAVDGDGDPACALRVGLRLASGRSDVGTRDLDRATSRDYREFDAVVRLNPILNIGPDPSGWALGMRAGLTHMSGSLPYPGLGIEVDRMWRVRRRLLVGAGAGVKGVMVLEGDPTFATIPALRLNVDLVF